MGTIWALYCMGAVLYGYCMGTVWALYSMSTVWALYCMGAVLYGNCTVCTACTIRESQYGAKTVRHDIIQTMPKSAQDCTQLNIVTWGRL